MYFETYKYPNGFTLAVGKMPHAELIAAGIWINVGPRNETPKNNGISHMVEHMVTYGIKGRRNVRIHNVVESIGGTTDAETDEECTGIHAKVFANDAPVAYGVLLDTFSKPSFPRARLAPEKSAIIEEIKADNDNPVVLTQTQFQKKVLSNHAASWPVTGTIQNVASFTRGTLIQHHGAYYHAANACMAVAGATTLEEVKKLIDERVEALPVREKLIALPLPPEPEETMVAVTRRKLEQVHVAVGMRSFPFEHPMTIPFRMANEILGGNQGSRFFRQVREKRGLVYEIDTSSCLWTDGGVWSIDTQVSPGKLIEALEVAFKQMDRLADRGPTPKEVEFARNQHLGNIARLNETTHGTASHLGSDIITFNRVYSTEELAEKFRSVTAREIRDSVREVWAKPLCASVVGSGVKSADLRALVARR